jgi:hypothetical protein
MRVPQRVKEEATVRLIDDAPCERETIIFHSDTHHFLLGRTAAISKSQPLSFSSRYQQHWRHAKPALALALGFPWQNGCLQQIAANRFSTPQDVIAILLQGFVRRALVADSGFYPSFDSRFTLDLSRDAFKNANVLKLLLGPRYEQVHTKHGLTIEALKIYT